MNKTYFDKNGKEIKAGMTIYLGTETDGTCIPVVLHDGCLCFDVGFFSHRYVSLDAINPSDGIIQYDPEVDTE